MFYVRTSPWYGLRLNVKEAHSYENSLAAASLDWNAIQKSIFTSDNDLVPSYKTNIRKSDKPANPCQDK